MNNLIINADDFGAKSSANRAIIELFGQGLLNSTTLMANMPAFEEAVELAHERSIEDKIGVHLVLTEGQPVTEEIKALPYLFNKEHISRKILVRKLFYLDALQKKLIFKEYSEQIEKVKARGIKITHLDTHQHMHDMWGVLQVIIKLLKVYKIPAVRILNNLDVTGVYKFAYRNCINNYLSLKKLNFSDYFGSREDYVLALKKHPNFNKHKVMELMVHPDYNAQGKLIDLFPGREYDFEFLKN